MKIFIINLTLFINKMIFMAFINEQIFHFIYLYFINEHLIIPWAGGLEQEMKDSSCTSYPQKRLFS